MASAAWAVTYPVLSGEIPWTETPLTGTSGSYRPTSNVGAVEGDTEILAGWANKAWWSWRAPSSGKVIFNVEGIGDFDPVMGILTGASEDDYAFPYFTFNGTLNFSAVAGERYLIFVADYNGIEGSFNLTWSYQGSSTPSYTVWFGAGEHGRRTGGGALKQTVSAGGTAAAPTITPYPGYDFIGWDKALGPINEHNYAITALYRAKDCGVTFDPGSKGKRTGGGAAKQTIPFGGGVANPPVVKGYDGWKAIGWDRNVSLVTRSTTFAEQYDIPICAATFVIDSAKGRHIGGGAMKQSVGYGNSPVPPGVKPYAGHVFKGWSPAVGAMTKSQTYTAIFE